MSKQARIQEFSFGGGVFGFQLSEKKNDKQTNKQTNKKKTTKRGEGVGFSIYSALVWSNSNLAIETTFKIITLINIHVKCMERQINIYSNICT